MKNIVLYAPPAAGKGTQCELLTRDFGYEVLSIGNVLRSQRDPNTEIGRKIIETQDKGILTPDDIVIKALNKELEKYSGKPLVIEGFPRNIDQANLLDTIFKNYIVINLDISSEIAEKRTLGRATCNNCGKIYNIYFEDSKPKVEGICDTCESKLSIRTDDNSDSFRARFGVYEQNAPSIIEYYKNKGNLYIVDSSVSKEDVYSQIKEILKGENND